MNFNFNKDLFSDLVLGNYRPCEDIVRSEKTKQLDHDTENIKSTLLNKLDNDSAELLIQFDDNYQELLDEHGLDMYKAGAKFAIELFINLFSNNSEENE